MSRPCTILLVHNHYQIPGGEDAVVTNERRLLEAHGHRVVPYFRHNDELKAFSPMRKLLFAAESLFSLRTYRDIKRLIRAEKIDIVHVHNTLAMVTPAVYYAARACGVPVVQTVHNFRMLCPAGSFFREGRVCEDCLHGGMRCAVRRACYHESRLQTLLCVLNSHLHRHIYKHLHFIFLTEFNRDKHFLWNRAGKAPVFEPTRVHIKPNFVFSAPAAAERPREKRFVYAGRLEPIKGVLRLLEAWKLLGENAPELLLCGTGPLEEECRAVIEEGGLTQVKMLGFVPNEQLRQLLATSAAFILPSQVYEGFPMTVTEAYAAGTPVLGSAHGNVGSLVRRCGGMTFRHDDAADIAATIRRFLQEGAAVNHAATLQMTSAEENYKMLAEIYEKAMGDK
ncbi:MAG: glycosyltransferase family 4 protein [Akkermansia sp.]|nr:glycosyltransferase family 4 protein [Akkermansia sp.]